MAFLRIATNPRVFERPLSTSEAEAAISSWLGQPAAGILDPGARHWEILRGLVRDGQAAGPLVLDAVLAAIALQLWGSRMGKFGSSPAPIRVTE
jgi:hypothetical protein